MAGVQPEGSGASAAPVAAPQGPARARARLGVPAAAAVCALLAVLWLPVSTARSWGWDESMHVELPAARTLLAAKAGALGEAADVLLGCQQYPFGYPLALAAVQAVSGVSEVACRTFGRLLWCFGCFGLFLLGRELVRRSRAPDADVPTVGPPLRRRGADDVVPWLALAFGAASPLALAYSGMLFQESAFLVVSIFALRAWLRRHGASAEGRVPRRELAAGAWLVAAFFTRFNNGVLLGFGLFLDLAVEGALAAHAGRLAPFLRRTAWLAALPVLAFLWWFVLPLPGGIAVGASHRDVFVRFLAGNRDPSMYVPWDLRTLHWLCSFAYTPRVFLVELVGLFVALRFVSRPGPRCLALVLFGAGLPVWTHNFHQDRFLLPSGAALWPLAALGLARLLPTRGVPRALALSGLALGACLSPALDSHHVFDRTVGFRSDPEVRAYQERLLAEMRDLSGDRPLATNGLARAESAAVLDLLAAEVGPEESVGWLGMSTKLSPAAVQIGLFLRGGSPARFRRETARNMFLSIEHVDGHWPAEQVLAWAAQFDVVIATDPVDLASDPKRAWLARYRDLLVSDPAWTPRSLGVVEIASPLGVERAVTVYACRREGE